MSTKFSHILSVSAVYHTYGLYLLTFNIFFRFQHYCTKTFSGFLLFRAVTQSGPVSLIRRSAESVFLPGPDSFSAGSFRPFRAVTGSGPFSDPKACRIRLFSRAEGLQNQAAPLHFPAFQILLLLLGQLVYSYAPGGKLSLSHLGVDFVCNIQHARLKGLVIFQYVKG